MDNKMKTIPLEKVKELIKEHSGEIFAVTFVKRGDKKGNGAGEIRKMNCRIGVKKGVNGNGLPYDPSSKGLMPVYDMQKDAWRSINLDSVIDLALDGERYITK